MTDMNDEKLTLYYYDDGLSDAERREVKAALDADAELRARYESLCRELDALKPAETGAAPADMVARFHDTIHRAAKLDAQRTPERDQGRGFHFLSFAWGGAVAAVLVAGIAIGVYIASDDVAAPVDVPVATTTSSGSFARGLKVHLAESNNNIAAMPIDTAAERTLLIRHIVQQNRIFELAAEQNGSDNLARVLRAFEPILVELAREDLAPEDAEALRSQLMFELNVVLTKLSRDSSDETDTI